VRAQLRVGDPLGERRDARHEHRRRPVGLAFARVDQRVDRGDPQADQVRRRREVRLVGDTAARVPAGTLRRQPRAELVGELAGLVVATGDDEQRRVALGGERGDGVGAQRLGDDGAPPVEHLAPRGIAVEVIEQRSQGHALAESRGRRRAGPSAPAGWAATGAAASVAPVIPPFVDQDWLAAHPEAVLADVRWAFSGPKREAYLAGHVPGAVFVDLDADHYKLVGEFDKRFPEGAPSLRKATKLEIDGDWTFGRGVQVIGAVELQTASAQRVDPESVLSSGG